MIKVHGHKRKTDQEIINSWIHFMKKVKEIKQIVSFILFGGVVVSHGSLI
jgi:hypothetical protein